MRAESASAIDRLLSTVESIKSELDSLKTITDMATLSRLEDRIRQECQVIEALPGYMGQEIFRRVQIRRNEIRQENMNHVRSITEVTDGSRNSGANRDTGGSDKPGGAEQEGDTKTKRPSRQSKSKK